MTWSMTLLSEVAEIDRRGVSPASVAPSTRYVGLEHVDPKGVVNSPETVESAELKSTKFEFTSSHVLFGKLRPYLCKIARPGFDGVCSTDILPILPGRDLDPGYLYHFLRQPSQVELATRRSSGANLPRLSPKELAKFEIPLPPLEAQKRIATILDAADELRTKRRESLAKLDALLQSIFLDLFGDPVTNTMGWDRMPFGECIEDQTKRATKIPKSGYMDTGEWQIIDQSQKEIAGYADSDAEFSHPLPVVVFGDHTRCVKLVRRPFLLGADGAKVLAPKPSMDPVYLANLMPLADLPDLGYSRHMKEVKRLTFPLPPLSMQNRFARIVESTERQRKLYKAQLEELDTLFASLLSRAFRGEL